MSFNLPYNKNKLYKTLDCWSRDKLSFDFFEKGMEIVSPPQCVHDFSRKTFFCFILLTVTKFNCLTAFTSWAIEPYVHCNFLLTRLWQHRIFSFNLVEMSKKIDFKHWFQPEVKRIFFYFISHRVENILPKICILYKNVLWKKGTLYVDFINNRDEILNFKMFKV